MKYRNTALVVGGLLLAVWLAPLGRAHEINPSVRLDGAPLLMDVPATIDLTAGRTLAPVRHMAEALGYLVDWDPESKTAFVERDGHYIAFEVGAKEAVVDGETVAMDVAPRLVRGRVLVPLRFFAELAGAGVAWDETTMSIDLISPTSATAGPAFRTEGATFGAKAVEMWQAPVASDSSSGTSATITGEGMVFAPGARELTALNRENGEIVWTAPLAGSSTPVFDPARGMLYVTTGTQEATKLHGLDAATGEVIWFAAIGGNAYRTPQPLLLGSKVVVNTSDSWQNSLVAFDADNGGKLWQVPVKGTGTPVAFGARMFLTNEYGGLEAYRTIDGHPLWSYESGRTEREYGQQYVLVDQGRVYLASGQSVTALDEATGERRWQARGVSAAGGLASDGAQVWVSVRDGLNVLDAATGELVRYPAICSTSPSAPAVSRTHAFVACDGAIYAVDQGNFMVTRVGAGRGPLTLEGDRLYITRDGALAVLMAVPR
ncbi:MAG: copper amine oxidase-like protein [Symbiobacteriaceae bacterium]|nr:copper amine oxidase-like protein [Symbiobacteriaceae bacterium]